MRKTVLSGILVAAVLLATSLVVLSAAAVELQFNGVPSDFKHGIVLTVDGEQYYFAGPADGEGGAKDVPGHYWLAYGENKVFGLHYNTGPNGAAKWWSSDAPDGALLFLVDGVIDTWSQEKASEMIQKGYTHYHELVGVVDGEHHPTKIVWLKHIAVGSFTFDGGPMPHLGHQVTEGIDWLFMPNYFMKYST